MSDDSAAIKMAAKSTWGEAEQLDCYFHVKK